MLSDRLCSWVFSDCCMIKISRRKERRMKVSDKSEAGWGFVLISCGVHGLCGFLFLFSETTSGAPQSLHGVAVEIWHRSSSWPECVPTDLVFWELPEAWIQKLWLCIAIGDTAFAPEFSYPFGSTTHWRQAHWRKTVESSPRHGWFESTLTQFRNLHLFCFRSQVSWSKVQNSRHVQIFSAMLAWFIWNICHMPLYKKLLLPQGPMSFLARNKLLKRQWTGSYLSKASCSSASTFLQMISQ